jgi:hypothetical protein
MEVLIKILGKNYHFAEMIGGLIVIVQRMNVSFIQNVFHLSKLSNL